ncbi:MAG: hypothetical protein GSR85_07900 [Desulfurococcales archaeon]|nr:hypothetical protein [Desulfurococcales archaeon]
MISGNRIRYYISVCLDAIIQDYLDRYGCMKYNNKNFLLVEGSRRLHEYKEIESSCREKYKNIGNKLNIINFVRDLYINYLNSSGESHSLDNYAILWYSITRFIPSDVIAIILNELDKKYNCFMCKPPEYVIKHIYKREVEGDFHVHFGSVFNALISWLLRINTNILRSLSSLTLEPLISPWYLASLHLSALLNRLVFINLNYNYSLSLKHVSYSKRPVCPLEFISSRKFYKGLVDAEILWNRLSRATKNRSRVKLDPIFGNDMMRLLSFENHITSCALDIPGRCGPNSSSYASLYLISRLLAHRIFALMPGYKGLYAFSTLFSVHSRTTKKKRNMRLRKNIIRLGLLEYSVPVHVKVSIDEEDFRIIRSLINKSDPALSNVTFVLSLLKDRSRCEEGYYCIGSLGRTASKARYIKTILKKRWGPKLFDKVEGFDVAGVEINTPNWVFSPFMNIFVPAIENLLNKRLIITYHAGEEYYDVFDGLRRMYEVIVLIGLRPGDRIGHGLALGLHRMANTYYKPLIDLLYDRLLEYKLFRDNIIDYGYKIGIWLEGEIKKLANYVFNESYNIDDLIDAYEALYKPFLLSGSIWSSLPYRYTKHVDELYLYSGFIRYGGNLQANQGIIDILNKYLNDPFTSRRGSNNVAVTLGIEYKKRAEEIGNYLINEIGRRNIYIEVCPTSNAVLHDIEPIPHPVISSMSRYNLHKNNIKIGSDNPAIIDTNIINELLYL